MSVGGHPLTDREGPPPPELVIDRALDRLSRIWPGFEPRAPQREMAIATYRAFRHGGRAAIEAPTGVGKSVAYLVAAVLVARDHRMRVVISTHTKNLQQQIVEKDAPRVRDALAPELSLAILKGRRSYLCRRVYESRFQEELLPGARRAFMDRLHAWAQRTTTGDLDELGARGAEERAWLRELAAPEDLEAGIPCTRHTPCHLRESRRRAATSAIVVVNHALLLTHHLTGAKVLPDHDVVILDEAHTLPGVATSILERRVSPSTVRGALARLVGGRELGLLARVSAMLGAGGPESTADVSARAARVRRLSDAAFVELGARLGRDARRYGRREAEEGLLGETMDPFLDEISQLAIEAGRVGARLGPIEELDEDAADAAARFLSAVTALAELAETARFALEVPDPTYVHWFEPEPALVAVPLEPGAALRERLFEGAPRVLLTSATLAAGGGMHHMLDKLGLAEDAVEPLVVPSVFPLDRQVLALAPPMPDPTEPAHADAVSHALSALATRVPHKTLALFTSHRLLGQVRERIGAALDGEPITVLAQGIDGSREEVTRLFRRAERAVLLGTSSFWEGVDFPGEELELLVVTRLPFLVPTDPVVAARSEAIESRGGSAFRELLVPDAVLRFRQGFGRLIRRRTDRGVFVILDPRIRTRSYGPSFRAALPVPIADTEDVDAAVVCAGDWLRHGKDPT